MKCPHQSPFVPGLKNGRFRCALGLGDNGLVFSAKCTACIKAGENNKEFADKAIADYAKSHPEEKRGTLRECCGSALNY